MKKIFSSFMLLALLAATFATSLAVPAKTGDNNNDAATERLLNWEATGPMGGDVRSLVVDPQDPQRLYFSTIDGQIYTSTDGAQTWSRLPGFNRPGLIVDSLIVDPRNSQVIFAAAHRHKEAGGFFKTTDGGTTWRESEQLKGEALHSLAQSPSNPDVLVAGTNTGIFRSKDAGDTWEQLPTSATPGLINVESLAIDPRDPNAIYAGTWYLPYKTTDGGQTWKIVKQGIIDDSDIFAIEIDDHSPNHVIASACSGIYETKDAGGSWRKVNGIPSQSRRTRAIMVNPAKPQVIYAGTTEGFWLSTNGGADWKVTTNRQSFEVNAIAVHPKNPDTIYIGTNNYGVMISRDGGRTFTPSNEGYSGRRAYAIMPDREQPGRIYATTINTATGGGYFYVSNDDGATWQLSARNMPGRLIAYSILQDIKDGNVIYLGTNYGLYRSTDRGASWSPMGAPKPKVSARSARGRARAGRRGAASSAHASSRGAATTARVASSHTSATAAGQETAPPRAPAPKPPVDANVKLAQGALNAAGYKVGMPDGVAGTRTVAVIRKYQADKGIPVTGKFDSATLTALGLGGGMQSAGATADSLQTAPVYLTDTINFITHTFDERDGRPGLLAATNAGLFRSYDVEKGWERLTYGQGFDARTLCVSTSPQNPATVYVGTATSGVLVSRDAGKSWEQVKNITAEAPINVIEQDPKRAAYVYVGTTQTLYISHDGGEKWLRRGGGLPLGSFTSILVNAENPDELYVGNAYERGGRVFSTSEGGGVFRSADAGMTWQRVDPPLPSRRVWALAFDPRDPNRILVGSHSAGVYVARRDATASSNK